MLRCANRSKSNGSIPAVERHFVVKKERQPQDVLRRSRHPSDKYLTQAGGISRLQLPTQPIL